MDILPTLQNRYDSRSTVLPVNPLMKNVTAMSTPMQNNQVRYQPIPVNINNSFTKVTAPVVPSTNSRESQLEAKVNAGQKLSRSEIDEYKSIINENNKRYDTEQLAKKELAQKEDFKKSNLFGINYANAQTTSGLGVTGSIPLNDPMYKINDPVQRQAGEVKIKELQAQIKPLEDKMNKLDSSNMKIEKVDGFPTLTETGNNPELVDTVRKLNDLYFQRDWLGWRIGSKNNMLGYRVFLGFR